MRNYYGIIQKSRRKAKETFEKMLEKYGLSNLPTEYSTAIKNINDELAGSGLSEFGNLLAPDPATSARVQTQFLNAIVQQNWIIIRQLDELNKNLKK